MGILISDDEAEAILKACKEYLAIVDGDGFDGQGKLAWDRTIGALYDYEEKVIWVGLEKEQDGNLLLSRA